MGQANAMRALGPVWFRFTNPDDAGKYGDQWFRYNEEEIMRLRARALIELETDLGMPLPVAMNGFRASSVVGDTAAAWIGVRMADPSLAGDFDDFDIASMSIEWSMAEPTRPPKGEVGPESSREPLDLDSQNSSSGNTTSAPTDTVALPSMPAAE